MILVFHLEGLGEERTVYLYDCGEQVLTGDILQVRNFVDGEWVTEEKWKDTRKDNNTKLQACEPLGDKQKTFNQRGKICYFELWNAYRVADEKEMNATEEHAQK